MSVVINGSAGVTTNSGAVYNGIQAGTAVASTSGTSIDFTSIPSWVKRITVMFVGVSTNSTSNIQVQLGDSGGIETSGYSCSAIRFGASSLACAAFTSGFVVNYDTASIVASGVLTIVLQDSATNTWAASGSLGTTTTTAYITSGSKATSATLDRIRITTVNGTDTFDAGSINILYE